MEFQTLLETRRSVRSYLPGGKPDAETIKKLIAAAQEAPSWKNTETGRYHCVLSDEMTAKFQETCLPPFNATRSTNAAYLVATYVRDVSGYNVHEKTPENASALVESQIREKEGERVRARLEKVCREGTYVIALAIDGKQLDSVELSQKLEQLGTSGVSHIVFLIGGSLGMSEQLLRKADFKLSFSKMTFPHQLMRVILLEQIYRGFMINNGRNYHK